jgi:hypothetical protein
MTFSPSTAETTSSGLSTRSATAAIRGWVLSILGGRKNRRLREWHHRGASSSGSSVKARPGRPPRSFGTVRLASGGEGPWHGHGGEYAYIELTLDDVEYNVWPR